MQKPPSEPIGEILKEKHNVLQDSIRTLQGVADEAETLLSKITGEPIDQSEPKVTSEMFDLRGALDNSPKSIDNQASRIMETLVLIEKALFEIKS